MEERVKRGEWEEVADGHLRCLNAQQAGRLTLQVMGNAALALNGEDKMCRLHVCENTYGFGTYFDFPADILVSAATEMAELVGEWAFGEQMEHGDTESIALHMRAIHYFSVEVSK